MWFSDYAESEGKPEFEKTRSLGQISQVLRQVELHVAASPLESPALTKEKC